MKKKRRAKKKDQKATVAEQGRYAFLAGDFFASVDLFSNAILQNETNAHLYGDRGASLLHVALGCRTDTHEYATKLSAASDDARKCIELEPHYWKGYKVQGDVFREQGVAQNAKTCYLKALKCSQLLHSCDYQDVEKSYLAMLADIDRSACEVVLLRWLRDNDAYFDKLGIQTRSSDNRNVTAMVNLRENDEILRIPFRCCVPHERGMLYPIAKALAKKYPVIIYSSTCVLNNVATLCQVFSEIMGCNLIFVCC
jgi:hypothetical protein